MVHLKMEAENLEAPSEDPILQFQTTGVRNQWFREILLINVFQIILKSVV
jgi:hypothetical protein